MAIDGPAASGKTTIGKMLADHLGYLFLDTGSMYRATTFAALEQGIDIANETKIVALTEKIHIRIENATEEDEEGYHYTVYINGRNVTLDLRTQAVDRHVSQVSAYPGVRRQMVELQRAYGDRGRVVMVGRDIGTVVLPHAPLKLYISASAEERARRRWLERQATGDTIAYENILADVIRRDKIDSSREHSPLRPAADAILIDSSGRDPATILAHILQLSCFQVTPKPVA
ncbi:MAG: (d)CMP kinase [Chloroflexi bacterium]|nr:(d)CMP kinase [Chloroflexota bacterium]MBP8056383.1 (d)CMP kinase [Chloroflexota bacterium]